MKKILVIDDERSIRNSLKDILEFEGYAVEVAEDGMKGIHCIQNTAFDAVFCDIKMPQMDGIEVLEKLAALDIMPPVIMISGHGDIETAVNCIQIGAFDYIAKPLDLNRILIAVKNALDKSIIVAENKTLKKKLSQKYDMVGESNPILELKEMVAKVAPTEARVLIIGANGTGKELVAHALHEQGNRSNQPFIEVNCAAIPSELIESELFGHEKGAFTSAIKQKKGQFELADNGTIFLDEIGDMSLSAQAKVLRALQEHKITRVGGEKEITINVRVIAATNKDLKKEIQLGNFREDLYHRLCIILLKVPSLNDRKGDIPLLINHFNELIGKDYGTSPKLFTPEAIIALQNYDWTGNIRQLRNVVERLIILSGATIEATDVEKYT